VRACQFVFVLKTSYIEHEHVHLRIDCGCQTHTMQEAVLSRALASPFKERLAELCAAIGDSKSVSMAVLERIGKRWPAASSSAVEGVGLVALSSKQMPEVSQPRSELVIRR
jgi:hypothetical protein